MDIEQLIAIHITQSNAHAPFRFSVAIGCDAGQGSRFSQSSRNRRAFLRDVQKIRSGVIGDEEAQPLARIRERHYSQTFSCGSWR